MSTYTQYSILYLHCGLRLFTLLEAERVLGTPELLTCILEAALPEDQVSATVVCQAWNEQAVRVIWRDVPSVIPLLKLLAPPGSMRKNSEGHWEYTSSIEFKNWAQLSLYGRYVHTLVQFRDDERVTSAAYQAVAQAAMGRPAVLPNLRKIVWTLQDISAASGLTILCSSSVRALELDMSLSPIPTVLWVFRNLRGRIQNIRELSIGVPERMLVQNAEDSLSEL
ncbi:hypothetical protein FRC03_006767 [Tulasnella sp. 419]|nr:hypothetical protein FRC03_006767 [Tulasnella sp. 419]